MQDEFLKIPKCFLPVARSVCRRPAEARPQLGAGGDQETAQDQQRGRPQAKAGRIQATLHLIYVYLLLIILSPKYRQDKLPWIERLDMVNAPAPLAPELAYEEDQGHQEQRHHVLYLYHLSTFIKCIDLGPFLH